MDLIDTVLAPARDGRCEDQLVEVSGSIVASPVTHFCGTNTHLHCKGLGRRRAERRRAEVKKEQEGKRGKEEIEKG